MKLIKKEETWYQKKYNILGIKVNVNKKIPPLMSITKRAKALKKFFFKKVGYDLNLANPQTFNEKINWMKLYYRNDLMTRIVDKYEFKNYIKEQLGDGYTVPLLGAWDNVDDIDFDKLPDKFVLKCNAQSDSKFIKIVRDKNELDIEALKLEMQDWLIPIKTLKNSYCWAYYNVPLKIIAEEYIEQIDGQVYDYKFMCFGGEPKWVLACSDRGNNTVYENHDMDWELIIPSPKSATKATIARPKHFEKMVEIAKKLAAPFPFVRVDFYEIGDSILLGEMTFYPNGGFNSYKPYYDKKFGDYIKLPNIDVKYPFFEKVKRQNKRIINICGKKVLSFHKIMSKKALTNKLINVEGQLVYTKNSLKLIQEELNQAKKEIEDLKKNSELVQKDIKKIKNELNSRPKLRPSRMRLEERIEALKWTFSQEAGYSLNLLNPQTFNEKINWLKLFYRNDLMTRIVDKYEFKNYIREQLGDGYTVPLLGAWDNVDDIDFDKLPDKFVLKCNAQSDSKFIKIVRDKSELDIEALKKEMQDWLIPEKTLKTSYCWAYYNVPLKIIAEEYIPELEDIESDYKFFCFNGMPKCFYKTNNWAINKLHDERTVTYYDMNRNPLPLTYNGYKKSDISLEGIENFDKMVKLAEILSKDLPFVRVDFYELNNKLYIGEMTFYPGGGYGKYEPFEWNYKLGEMIDLTKIELDNLEILPDFLNTMKITK